MNRVEGLQPDEVDVGIGRASQAGQRSWFEVNRVDQRNDLYCSYRSDDVSDPRCPLRHREIDEREGFRQRYSADRRVEMPCETRGSFLETCGLDCRLLPCWWRMEWAKL